VRRAQIVAAHRKLEEQEQTALAAACTDPDVKANHQRCEPSCYAAAPADPRAGKVVRGSVEIQHLVCQHVDDGQPTGPFLVMDELEPKLQIRRAAAARPHKKGSWQADVEADLAAGVRVAWLERHPFQGPSLGAYLRAPAPRPPFPGRIDRARAERGRRLFKDNCTPCHGSYDGRGVIDYEEKVIPLADVLTDPTRALAATDSFVDAANDPALTRGYTRFRRTGGYVPPVLVDVWARAPYGHAGQWPSLRFLATPPARRPHRFTVAYDAPYDLDAVGLSTEPHGRGDYAYDADAPGFGVDGHPFLADLGEADAADVIEYLKTL